MNTHFATIGSTLAAKIPPVKQSFESFINKTDSQRNENPLSVNEVKEVFFSLKMDEDG